MCYLLSAITGQSSGAGHISAVKGSSSSSGSQTLDLAGTWVHLKTEPNNFYYRYTMVLRSAGAKTWNGKITMDTNHQPGDTVGYTISHLRLFEGAVTVTLSAGNKISLRLRRNVAGAPDLQEMGDLLDNNSTIATGTFRFTRK
jgi:hypothetical protein